MQLKRLSTNCLCSLASYQYGVKLTYGTLIGKKQFGNPNNHGGKREGAGRSSGSTTQNIKIERVLESVGVDPIEILACIAHGDSDWLGHLDKQGDAEPIALSMRANAASELMKY